MQAGVRIQAAEVDTYRQAAQADFNAALATAAGSRKRAGWEAQPAVLSLAAHRFVSKKDLEPITHLMVAGACQQLQPEWFLLFM
jgi:hypothetical protein